MNEFRNTAKMTLPALAATTFGRPQSGLSRVGILTARGSWTSDSQIRIEGDQFVIGRGEAVDGIDLHIDDDNVSRRHARIIRSANQYVIEDLNSSNGTFLDGIPIRTSLMHDGDTIQLGRRSFYFDQLVEFGKPPLQDVPSKPATRKASVDIVKPRDDSRIMTVRFWGTRGSIPTPGSKTSKYGGNTTCLEIRFEDTVLVVDAGSGIREMSKAWSEQCVAGPIHVSLLFTHEHWDHIQGFPFFAAGYQKGNTIDVYGARSEAGSPKELLSGQMQGAYFPVPLAAMQATLNFYETQQTFTIGRINVESFRLPHPGGSLGYRFTAGESMLVVATDNELDQIATNQDELKADHLARRKFDPNLMRWMQNADVLIIDCQYTDDEYQGKVGWGHNSIATIVDVCEQARPKMMGLFHHDPMSLDDMVNDRVNETAERILQRGIKDTLVFGAREQLCLAVQAPKRPIKIE